MDTRHMPMCQCPNAIPFGPCPTGSKRLADIEVGTLLAAPLLHMFLLADGNGLPPAVAFLDQAGTYDGRIVAIRIWNAILGAMEGTEYRVMLSGSDRYYIELTRQGESSCTTSDFATQSAAQDWIDQDREREGASDRRWQVASRRWPWWMHLWWRA